MTRSFLTRSFAIPFACAALLTGGACSPAHEAVSPAPEAGATLHPVSGLEVVALTVAGPGGEHRFAVEVARTRAEQAQGLMFRTELGENEGMIFPRNPPDIASFWMKNTPLPLDIIFIGIDGKIINIAAQTTPYSRKSVVADGLTATVLEIAGGRAASLGIAPGDSVRY